MEGQKNIKYWSSFTGENELLVCGPAGVAIYSRSDLSKPLTTITHFGGVACAAYCGSLLAIVGRPCVRESQNLYSVTCAEPNLGVWLPSVISDKFDRLDPEEEDEDMVRNHGLRSVRILQIKDDSGNFVPSPMASAELFMKTAVCGVGLSFSHLVVVLEDCVVVYKLADIVNATQSLPRSYYGPIVNNENSGCRPCLTIPTNPNPNGVFALRDSLLALPGEKPGSVKMHDLARNSNWMLQDLCGHDIAALAISKDGQKLAACSFEGKNIYVVPTSTAVKSEPRKYHRGNKPKVPTCLAFSRDGMFVMSASVSGSVHIFDLSKVPSKPDETEQKKQEKGLLKRVGDAFIDGVTHVYNAAWQMGWKDYISPKELRMTSNVRVVCDWCFEGDKVCAVAADTTGKLVSWSMSSDFTKIERTDESCVLPMAISDSPSS